MDLITAIHEAGHAAAYRRLFPNWYMFGVACVPDEEQEEEGAAGWSANEQLSGDEDDQARDEFDTYLCAGYGAVLAAGYSEDEAAAGCASDFGNVQGDLVAAKVKALNLMRQPENVKAVKRIADELMLRRRLHPDHVTVLIHLSDGEVTESEYREMLSTGGTTTIRRWSPKPNRRFLLVPCWHGQCSLGSPRLGLWETVTFGSRNY